MKKTDITANINNTIYKVKDICKELGLGEQGYYKFHYVKGDKEQTEKILLSLTDKIYRNIFGNLVSVQPIKSKPFITYKQLCEERGLDAVGFRQFKHLHPNIGLEEAFDLYEQVVSKRSQPTFKEKCEKVGITVQTARGYKSKHPELTEEQIIQMYLGKQKQIELGLNLNLEEKCEKAGVNFNQVRNIIYKNKEITQEEAIDYVKNISNNLKEACSLYRLNYKYVCNYKNNHPDLTNEQIINNCIQDFITFKEKADKLCKDNNGVFQLGTLLSYRNKHLELTDDQILEYYADKVNHTETFRDQCEKEGLNFEEYKLALMYKSQNKLTDKEAIDFVKEKKSIVKEEPLKYQCARAGVRYTLAKNFKFSHPELTNAQIVKFCLEKQQLEKICLSEGLDYNRVSHYKNEHIDLPNEQILKYFRKQDLKSICEQAGLSYNAVRTYRKRHPELTDEQAVNYYKEKEELKQMCLKFNMSTKRAMVLKERNPTWDNKFVINYMLSHKARK